MNDNQQQGILSWAINWPFMQEPIWRWVAFFIAIAMIMHAMNGILGYMGAAAVKVTEA